MMCPQDFGSSDDATQWDDDSTITFPGGTQQARLLQAGAILGRYRLIRIVGRGGFAQVWEAEDVGVGRRLALKILTHFRRDSPEALLRFKREGQLAASLNHPRTVYVFDAEDIQGHPVIAMELMPGGTLQDQVQLLGKLPVKHAVDFVLDAVEGLEAAQHAGVVHRDVKPSNCFIDEDGRAKIGDFGISQTLELRDNATVTTANFVGTPAYASPEQVRGRDVDFRSDIYSVGATLYTLLTGKQPFEGRNAGELLARILSEEPLVFTTHQVSVPRRLARIIGRCMAKDREKRYRSYAALRADLLPFSSSYRLAIGNLAKRTAAFVIDEAIIALSISALVNALGTGLLIVAAERSLHFLYYLLPERFWTRTIGKAAMGLRVLDASGTTMTFRQALLRTSSFAAIALPATLLELRIGTTPLLIVATIVVLISTMRRENGFAGPYELVSHTRVMAASLAFSISHNSSRLDELRNPSREKPHTSFGPYRVLRDIWRNESRALLLAFDEVLRRNVWIHIAPNENWTSDQLASIRPGKLRWLQGGVAGHVRWDAFEAPEGRGFYGWVQSKGRLTWADSRNVILEIAEELEARIETGEMPIEVSLRHIWVDARGRTRLLCFPATVGSDSTPMPVVDSQSAKKFLQQISYFALVGSVIPLAGLGTTMPGVALPEHARLILAQISYSDATLPLTKITAELRRISARPADVAWTAKVAMHAVIAGIPILVLIAYAIAPLLESIRFPQWRRDFERVPAYERLLTNMEAYGNVPEVKERREASCKLLAWIHKEAATQPGGRPLLYQMRMFQREKLESCDNEYPGVTAPEAAKARAIVEKEIPDPPNADFTDRLVRGADEIFRVGGLLWIFPVVLSFIFQPSAAARMFGFVLQTATGKPAEPWRCVVRSLVAWLPFVMFFPIVLLRQWGGYVPVPADYWRCDLLLGSVILVGIAYSIARPTRGLPDLLVGTCLVPK